MNNSILSRPIPSTGELLPVIGIGTWKGFDVSTSDELTRLTQVLSVMSASGGTLIDSSPMYGRAEEAIGKITSKMPQANSFFYATKVWTEGREEGIRQMETSLKLMNRQSIDLMQIHNLIDWKTHLETLRQWKETGKVRYIGITHYTDSMHSELASIIRSTPLDFVQFNYSITNRNAEKELLPLCQDRGVATLINRPVGEGKLLKLVQNNRLPGWAADLGISSWAQFFLRFLISHPAVTCVIPGTGNPHHMKDNMLAGFAPMPDEAVRERMAAYVLGL